MDWLLHWRKYPKLLAAPLMVCRGKIRIFQGKFWTNVGGDKIISLTVEKLSTVKEMVASDLAPSSASLGSILKTIKHGSGIRKAVPAGRILFETRDHKS